MHTRMAAELGADVVKTDYAGNVREMRSIIEGCPLPILVLGGSRHDAALDVVRGAMECGAAGVFFGRNVFQSEDMPAFLSKARSVLHGDDESAGNQ